MKYEKIILFLFMELSLCAQQNQTLTIHFRSRSAALEPSAQQKLAEMFLTADTAYFQYKVLIEGHTDNEGSFSYNERLSRERAEAVKFYFVNAGFREPNIQLNYFAFKRPVATNDQANGKQQNRRVQIILERLKSDPAHVMGLHPANKGFTVSVEEESSLHYPSGTVIHIPHSAFVHADGSPVNGSVQISYTEYRNVGDFIGSSIPMNWQDHNEIMQFNSAGMFKIEAFQDEQQLKLANNKSINLAFTRTGEVNDLKLFRLNPETNEWTAAAPPRSFMPQFGWPRSRFPGRWEKVRIATLRGRDSCVIEPEKATIMSINTGLRLSQEITAVYFKRANLHFSRKKLTASFPAKRIQITSRHKQQVKFKVFFEDDNSQNGLSRFEFVVEGSSLKTFKQEWEKTSWTDVTMTWLRDDEFFIFLTRNSEKMRLAVRGLYNGQPLCKNEFVNLVAQNKIPNMKLYDESLAKKNRKKRKTSFTEQRNYELCSDSLYCFYDWSQQWMNNNNGESELDYLDWLDYFNTHKAEMRSRYSGLKADQQLIIEKLKIETAMRRKKDSLDYLAEWARMETGFNLETSISINGLGVWNCDQLSRLKNPVTVTKNYFNTNGQQVEPVCIYVIDKSVNGVLTYNGNYGMSPSNFKVNAAATNMLLAYDSRNQVYICKQEWFDTAMKEGSPFLMEALAKEDVSGVIAEYTK